MQMHEEESLPSTSKTPVSEPIQFASDSEELKCKYTSAVKHNCFLTIVLICCFIWNLFRCYMLQMYEYLGRDISVGQELKNRCRRRENVCFVLAVKVMDSILAVCIALVIRNLDFLLCC